MLQAKRNQFTVQQVGSVVDNTKLSTTFAATARDAVLSTYGATQQNLQQAQGKPFHETQLQRGLLQWLRNRLKMSPVGPMLFDLPTLGLPRLQHM